MTIGGVFLDAIIKVEHLVKSYGDIKAVNDISFLVKRGSLFAFLGPNGAGKSTTINVMTTLLDADSGTVHLNGQTDDAYFRSKIGVVFQGNVLDDDLTVKENLVYRGALYLNDKLKVKQRYEELATYLNLYEFENQRFKTLSGGQKRRAEIARALFSNPEILLLDEPTTGLDPETRQIVWKVIEDLQKNKGMTIFLTTHYMEEAANADHVVIISKGKIVAEGTPAELKDKYSQDRLKIVPQDKKEMLSWLDQKERPYKKIADQFVIPVEDSREAIKLIQELKDNIKQFEMVQGTMDDVFIEVIGGENHV
ncbi:MAG: multidrug ABC transporter ATP-binding protein [Tenericutes bacterium GWC2_34_14]|nr:MAG: multidrug ABC transporter ATP-binding protein [Tenericutes bacterium GWA2_35_7]OHE30076.1 MAG: multidrug ABC transporter ATP-binding protein [Tenericutes bacterium GWC2_34_14]OHE35056.1 MAG: multidrug ABC transporter ATP-binding protein [Tenericutes bacterium GWE2_34_108]OHE37487.1 MAG: multidrug ABC transporter ATP-binding protein [Tenericutes bacterium GWF1_35_14]OHE39476.1 MAG: multidrug ABC transporter ATP-binding protein [Tenericutes bacterium GWF2_35_184]OHE42559.1 MAG: multidrug